MMKAPDICRSFLVCVLPQVFAEFFPLHSRHLSHLHFDFFRWKSCEHLHARGKCISEKNGITNYGKNVHFVKHFGDRTQRRKSHLAQMCLLNFQVCHSTFAPICNVAKKKKQLMLHKKSGKFVTLLYMDQFAKNLETLKS